MSETNADDRPKTSTRDHTVLRRRLTAWLATKIDGVEITSFTVPATNGMSSETILFDAQWRDGSGSGSGSGSDSAIASGSGSGSAASSSPVVSTDRFVLRLPPDPASEPVFMVYDMAKQFNVMRLVGERTGVAVPPTLWLEEDPSFLGAPFFVMGRVDGIVPPDVMPYTFGDNWFHDSAQADQLRLQRESLQVLAAIHSIPADDPAAAFLAVDAPGDTALRRHVNDQRAFYEWVCADGVRSPLIERAFEWLDANWPTDAETAGDVVSWGDARVGNMMYRDYSPVAVLDWEMAALGPREIDLAWMIFLHRFFQDLTDMMGLPGMPHFMRTADVTATYEELTGIAPHDMEWFLLYAALRHAVVMFRITRRSILFGEAVMPENPDHAFIHHGTLAAMLDGTYWSKL